MRGFGNVIVVKEKRQWQLLGGETCSDVTWMPPQVSRRATHARSLLIYGPASTNKMNRFIWHRPVWRRDSGARDLLPAFYRGRDKVACPYNRNWVHLHSSAERRTQGFPISFIYLFYQFVNVCVSKTSFSTPMSEVCRVSPVVCGNKTI